MPKHHRNYICKKLIEDGLMSNVITISDCGALTATIGEYWFYIGGSEYEYADKTKLPKYVLIDLIKDALDGFYNDPISYDENNAEYDYYYYYLIEHI